jgi:hypothetical protein
MAQREAPRDASKSLKKDRQAVQRLRTEIDEETPNTTVRTQQRDPNRDAARGDWDRSSRHHDEGSAPETPGTEAPPDEQYPDRQK